MLPPPQFSTGQPGGATEQYPIMQWFSSGDPSGAPTTGGAIPSQGVPSFYYGNNDPSQMQTISYPGLPPGINPSDVQQAAQILGNTGVEPSPIPGASDTAPNPNWSLQDWFNLMSQTGGFDPTGTATNPFGVAPAGPAYNPIVPPPNATAQAAPGVTPDVAPATAASPDEIAAQMPQANMPPITWAGPQAIPPGQPGSNLGGPQGPLYANTAPGGGTPPGQNPFQVFMNWLGNIPTAISGLIGGPGAYTPSNTDPWSNINANVVQSLGPNATAADIPQGVFSGLGSPLESPGGIGFGGMPGGSRGPGGGGVLPPSFANLPMNWNAPGMQNWLQPITQFNQAQGPGFANQVRSSFPGYANWPQYAAAGGDTQGVGGGYHPPSLPGTSPR
jgi:hypothetical protein